MSFWLVVLTCFSSFFTLMQAGPPIWAAPTIHDHLHTIFQATRNFNSTSSPEFQQAKLKQSYFFNSTSSPIFQRYQTFEFNLNWHFCFIFETKWKKCGFLFEQKMPRYFLCMFCLKKLSFGTSMVFNKNWWKLTSRFKKIRRSDGLVANCRHNWLWGPGVFALDSDFASSDSMNFL